MTNHRMVDQGGIGEDVDYEDVEAHERWTMALDSNGDVMFNEGLKTFRQTSATRAAKQSLLVALGTSKGEDPIDEEFGLDVFRATQNTVHLQREIQKTLLYDDKDHERVERVVEVNIDRMTGRHADVSVVVELDTGDFERLRFSAPL